MTVEESINIVKKIKPKGEQTEALAIVLQKAEMFSEENIKWDNNLTIRQSLVLSEALELTFKIFKVNYDHLKSKSRKRPIVAARHILMYCLHSKVGITLEMVGSIFNREHSTVIYACSKAEIVVSGKDLYKEKYEQYIRGFDLILKVNNAR